MASILVTGATGFFGSHLIRALQMEGHRLTILKRRQSSMKRIADIANTIAVFNLEDIDYEKILLDCEVDTIIHCATSYGRDEKNVYEVYQANIDFPIKLLDLTSKLGIKLFINIDSYFNKKINHCSYLDSYVLSKKHFMEWGSLYAKKFSIQFINVKLEHLYGPDDSASKFVPWLIEQCSKGYPEIMLSPGDQLRDFIYVSDAVNALSCLISNKDKLNDGYEEIGLGSGILTSVKKFTNIVHRLTKSRSKLIFGALQYRSGELMHSCAANHRLIALGWRPLISLEEGLKRTISFNLKGYDDPSNQRDKVGKL